MTAVMIHIYERGNYKDTLYFKSRAEGVKWLRTQGCRVREESTCHLGGQSVTFTVGGMVFEMEEDSIRNGQRR